MKAISIAVLASVVLVAPALAVPPPNLPLPPCSTDEDGFAIGACPTKDPHVDGSGVGRLSFNSSIGVYVEPVTPACHHWDANDTGTWSPDPCYREVFEPTVVGCAYVDVTTDRFVETECGRALSTQSSFGNSFDVVKGPGGECAAEADFWVYALGGPATQTDRIWSNRGPNAGKCELKYTGPEIDGLYGPTWVKVSATIDVVTGVTSTDSGSRKTSHFYVPIDGDLRDLGPVAGFDVAANAGGRVAFDNTSVHTTGESMTYRWDFGDGETSTTEAPEHRYTEEGDYLVTLTARDATGDEDTTSYHVRVELRLVVDLDLEPEVPEVGEPLTVTLTVTNPIDEPVTRFTLIVGTGLVLEPELLYQTSGPTPAVPSTIGPNETLTFTFEVEAKAPGRTTIESGARGYFGAAEVDETTSLDVLVPPRLDIALATTITPDTEPGDEFDVVATITNEEEVELTGIESEPLSLDRSDIISIVSGPIAADGSDPRTTPITLAAGASTTITWRYEADADGVVAARALVSGRDPNTNALFYVHADKRFAIQTSAIELTGVRLSPGAPVPGDFGLIRGTVENVGSVDVDGVDFTVTSTPELTILDDVLEGADAEMLPRYEKLEPGDTHDFLILFQMTTQADGFGHYDVDVTLAGTSEVEGEPLEVEHTVAAKGGLDLTDYWSNLLEDYSDVTLDFFEGVNTWGESSTLGGSVVGGGQGVISALQKTGDGLIDGGELFYGTVTGEYKLTEKGKQIMQTAREYYRTRSFKQIKQDFIDADLALGDVTDQVLNEVAVSAADWLQQLDTAYERGDAREVSRMLSEGTTFLALAAGNEVAAEQAFARIWGKIVAKGTKRTELPDKQSVPDPIDDPDPFPQNVADPETELPYAALEAGKKQDLRDLPTGVPLAESTVLRAGLNAAEHSWMRRMAKEHGVAFFVRPRPEAAARFAKEGFNAKPMAVKTKSVNDIDVKWLGWDKWKGSEGLVVMLEPKDPTDALRAAVRRKELAWDSEEVNAILKRYEKRKKEWAEKDALFDQLNGQNGGEGFDIMRDGKKVRTKVVLDADGRMRFTANNQPVYSDIDLLQVGRPDGTHIDPEVYAKILREAGPGFDLQHGATMGTSDFDNAEQAWKFVDEYGREHMRGGDPLVIIQGDVTTLGYVDTVSMDLSLPGSNMDLYGAVKVTYEGAGFP